MKLEINGREIKVTRLKPNNNDPHSAGRESLLYSFKAFSSENNGGDEWTHFYENEIKNDEYLASDRKNVCTAIFYQISTYCNWQIIGSASDQWGAITLENNDSKNRISIEFDSFEHGLLAAYLIVKQLDPDEFD